jgi:hypothetical protein
MTESSETADLSPIADAISADLQAQIIIAETTAALDALATVIRGAVMVNIDDAVSIATSEDEAYNAALFKDRDMILFGSEHFAHFLNSRAEKSGNSFFRFRVVTATIPLELNLNWIRDNMVPYATLSEGAATAPAIGDPSPPEPHPSDPSDDQDDPDVGLTEYDPGDVPSWVTDAMDGPPKDEKASIWQRVVDRSEPWQDPIWMFEHCAEPPRAKLAEIAPEPFIGYLQDETDRLGVDPGMVLLPALGAASTVADDRFRLQVKRRDTKWRERPTLWFVVLAESGTGKGPAMNAGGQDWLKRKNYEIRKTAMQSLKDYSQEHEIWRHAKEKAIKAGAEIPPEPEEPADLQLMVRDTTIEGLRRPMQATMRGIGLFHDELTAFTGGMNAYKSGGVGADREFYLATFDGGPYVINRASKNGGLSGNISIPNCSLTVVGTTTPGNAPALINGREEDGFIQRMLITCATGFKGEGEDREPDAAAEARFSAILENLLRENATPEDVLYYSDAGHKLREHFEAWRKSLMANALLSAERSQFSKWEGIFNRLVLLYALIEFADKGMAPRGEIPIDCVVRVYRFFREYEYHHVRYFWREHAGISPVSNMVQSIINLVLRLIRDGKTQLRPGNFSGDIHRKWVGDKNMRQLQEDALRILCDCNIIRDSGKRVTSKYAGTVWDINPLILQNYPERVAAEAERSNAIQENKAILQREKRERTAAIEAQSVPVEMRH